MIERRRTLLQSSSRASGGGCRNVVIVCGGVRGCVAHFRGDGVRGSTIKASKRDRSLAGASLNPWSRRLRVGFVRAASFGSCDRRNGPNDPTTLHAGEMRRSPCKDPPANASMSSLLPPAKRRRSVARASRTHRCLREKRGPEWARKVNDHHAPSGASCEGTS